MFKTIHDIKDIKPFVADKKEIRFHVQKNDVTVGCYVFADSDTFSTPESLECRGIAFDKSGSIVSRPLHKFFNLGEKDWLTPDKVVAREDIVAIYDKLDGSMISTAWVDGVLQLKSKKSFTSDVVRLATSFLDKQENEHIKNFATEVASKNLTAIFELTHPEARIVVAQDKPQLRLLHVRDNETGEYVLLDPCHAIHDLVSKYKVPMVQVFDKTSLKTILETLPELENREGYVIQFANGDMAKLKCPWYLRLHRSITFLRERDIAVLAINEELDDVKSLLAEAGINLDEVNKVEFRLKEILSGILDEIEAIYENGRDLDRKHFALANKSNPLFGLAIQRYAGNEVPLLEWYGKNRLKTDFSLRVLADGALAEAIED